MSAFNVLDLSPDDSTLILTAHYAFPPERVFSAWLDPESMVHWIKPTPSCRIEVLEFEAQVGGTFRVRMNMDEGEITYSGRFVTIDFPHRLEMTWQWEPTGDGDDYPETFMTIECEAFESGTRLTLTHEKMRSLESRDSHSEGWTSTLTELLRYLSTS